VIKKKVLSFQDMKLLQVVKGGSSWRRNLAGIQAPLAPSFGLQESHLGSVQTGRPQLPEKKKILWVVAEMSHL
jgi:hypothetical protein